MDLKSIVGTPNVVRFLPTTIAPAAEKRSPDQAIARDIGKIDRALVPLLLVAIGAALYKG